MSRILVPDNVTITAGESTTSPDLVTRYAARRRSTNVVHAIPDQASPWISLGVSLMRAGVFDLLYFERADAHSALELHAGATTLTYVDADQPERNMTYVVDGYSDLVHDAKSNSWRLTIEFQEISE